jgi:hypothetical protein
MDGDRTMQIWLGKQYLNQSDKQDQTITGDAVTVNFITHPKPKE